VRPTEAPPEPAPVGLRQFLEKAPAHGSTTDAVTDALRQAILDGWFAPETWLREDEIARDLKVSRTPVRDALRRLSDEHLTVHVNHRGTIVAPMTMDDILAVYTVREGLEGLAAQLTAARQPPGTVVALAQVHREMQAAAEDGRESELATLNLEFHRLLREGSGNSYLERFLTQVEHAVRRFGRSTFENPTRAAAAIAEHGLILQAIATGDAGQASRLASEHMRSARDARIQAMLSVG
jgi:DNA-binding GntR family transcriptional regulator